ncbi:hypothetical protein EJ04DRAFT_550511 [Polyplosphaeria fusca]|uniref:Uncharacterized protein n=1 Tax=Polyplosphaeria fusca TaxID=682080 RepID=A0A9P4R6Y5_9PLEO|nr:hypothetical protein EJ04DRAFT_550511 [Polyplosphaeria fusca]
MLGRAKGHHFFTVNRCNLETLSNMTEPASDQVNGATGEKYHSQDISNPWVHVVVAAQEVGTHVQYAIAELGFILDCFGQDVEEKIGALAELAECCLPHQLRFRRIIPTAACILVLATASTLAYLIVYGNLFPVGSWPAILLAGTIVYFSVMLSACIVVANT